MAPKEKHLRVSSVLCRRQHTCTRIHTKTVCMYVHAVWERRLCVAEEKKMILPELEYSKCPSEISPRVKAQYIKDRVKCPSWDHPYSNSFLPIIMSYLLELAQYYLPQQPPSPGSYLSCPLTALLMDKASPHLMQHHSNYSSCHLSCSRFLHPVLTLLLFITCLPLTASAHKSQIVQERLRALRRGGLVIKPHFAKEWLCDLEPAGLLFHEEWQDEVRTLPLPVGLGKNGNSVSKYPAMSSSY